MKDCTVHDVDQRTEQWHELRAGRVTGSMIGSILRVDRNRSYSALVREVATDERKAVSPDMQRGIDHEDDAIDEWMWAAMPGDPIERPGFVTPNWDPDGRLGFSPDAVVGDVLIEAKCPRKLPDEPNPAHVAQVQFGLQVCGLKRGVIVYWVDGEIRTFNVARWTDDEWRRADAAIGEFIADVAEYRAQVSARWVVSDEKAAEAVERLRHQTAELRALEALVKATREEVLAYTDGHDAQLPGARVTWSEQPGRVAWARYQKDAGLTEADLAEYRGKPIRSARVTFDEG